MIGDYFDSEGNAALRDAVRSGVAVAIDWVTGQWSQCSKTCGVVEGMQVNTLFIPTKRKLERMNCCKQIIQIL